MSATSEAPSPVGPVLCAAQSKLRAAGIQSPRLEARVLLAHVLGTEAGRLIGGGATVPPDALLHFSSLLARRIGREPLGHLTETVEFWSLRFEVGPDVLLPRHDSETLLEAALAEIGPRDRIRTVLDLGTGSGCLLIAALHELPGARGLGVDRNWAALAVARRNAERLLPDGRAGFVLGDWSTPIGRTVDLVLCNPPYIEERTIDSLAPEVAQFEPRDALSGGLDGLDEYRRIFGSLCGCLRPEALIVLELGLGQLEPVASIAASHGFGMRGVRRDLGGIERALILDAPP